MSDNSQRDILFWIEQEPTTKSLDYFMPNDTPVKNPSALTLNAESRKRKLRHRRSLSRLRSYSTGVLEDACVYVAREVDRSLLPRKPIFKFTSVEGDEFLKDKSPEIINLIQYFEDVKSGRVVTEPKSNSPEPIENKEQKDKAREEYKKGAENMLNVFASDITKKYMLLQTSLQVSYQSNSYFPDPQNNS